MAARYTHVPSTRARHKLGVITIEYEEEKDVDDYAIKQVYCYEVYGRSFKNKDAAQMWLKFIKIANLYNKESCISYDDTEHIHNWAYDNIEKITEILKGGKTDG